MIPRFLQPDPAALRTEAERLEAQWTELTTNTYDHDVSGQIRYIEDRHTAICKQLDEIDPEAIIRAQVIEAETENQLRLKVQSEVAQAIDSATPGGQITPPEKALEVLADLAT